MGKKVKKDDKSPPDDVFQPLQMEAKQAATAILMLESAEEDVVANACDALYKFAEKCDENRKTLLDLNIIGPLLRLIHSEDRVVRRNASMVLGAMSCHVDVRRALKKHDDVIPGVIALLQPEESTLVHEFASLCLASVAVDFTGKVAIFEKGGLEPLVLCLNENDPDVQKNCLEAISLMLQDYHSRTAIRDLNAFPRMLELMKSEYPAIQHLALVALQHAMEDAGNRASFRELAGLNQLINFVGHPEWADLHVFAIATLANCLDDLDSVKMLKENGGLAKLVALITDAPVPEEEEKKGKKDKKGSGKKGKDDDEVRMPVKVATTKNKHGKQGTGGGKTHDYDDDDNEQDDDFDDYDKKGKAGAAGSDAIIVPTIGKVKEYAARAVGRAARNEEVRKVLHEQLVEKMLIVLLPNEDVGVQVAAAQALAVLAESVICRDTIGQLGGVEPLVKLLVSESADVREAASLALANITAANANNCKELIRLQAHEPLIQLLSDSRQFATAHAASVLTNVAFDEPVRAELAAFGLIPALIAPLRSTNTVVQSRVCLALAAYLCDASARKELCAGGGVEPLMSLVSSNDADVRRSASWAVAVASTDEDTATEIARFNGLAMLQQIQQSETRKNAFTEVAFSRLLDNNLSAKYALTGCLEANNMIQDGFFDCGQLRPEAPFITLDDLSRQPVNQKRAILLVNAKPEKPVVSAQSGTAGESELTEKQSKTNVAGAGGRASRQARERGGKPRQQKEKDDKVKDDEGAGGVKGEQEAGAAGVPTGSEQQQPYVLPGDNTLVKHVEEVQLKIAPLPTTRDQVIALAQYVADKMGGPIERGQLSSFSWELAMSQLKVELKSNIVPIGKVKFGIHYHRALLFKVLADRIFVKNSLVRGEYNRAWNEVWLSEDALNANVVLPPKAYIVDLIHQPGRLMPADCGDAVAYQRL